MSAFCLPSPEMRLTFALAQGFCGEQRLDSAAGNLLRAVEHRDTSNLEINGDLNGGLSWPTS